MDLADPRVAYICSGNDSESQLTKKKYSFQYYLCKIIIVCFMEEYKSYLFLIMVELIILLNSALVLQEETNLFLNNK